MDSVSTRRAVYTCLALYNPFGVDVPLNFDIIHSLHSQLLNSHTISENLNNMSFKKYMSIHFLAFVCSERVDNSIIFHVHVYFLVFKTYPQSESLGYQR